MGQPTQSSKPLPYERSVIAAKTIYPFEHAGSISRLAPGLVAMIAWLGTVEDIGRVSLVHFAGGLLRVGVPFGLGVWLFRSKAFDYVPRVPIAIVGVILLVSLTIPPWNRTFFDIIAIFAVFPSLICFGAQASLSGVEEVATRWLGRMSYPVYLLHLPISQLVGFVAKAARLNNPFLLIALSITATVVGSVITLRLFDEPVRSWLTKICRKRTSASAAAGI